MRRAWGPAAGGRAGRGGGGDSGGDVARGGGGDGGNTVACGDDGGGGSIDGCWTPSSTFLEQSLEREFTPFFLEMTARVCGGGMSLPLL